MKLLLNVEITPTLLFEKERPEIPHNIIRLKGLVSFLKKDQNTISRPFVSIIDTGSPISVLPYFIWKTISVKKCGKKDLIGFHQDEKCKITCEVGVISMLILDQKLQNSSPLLKCLAYLVPEDIDNIPLVLGYDRCLEYFKLEADIRNKTAFLSL